MTATGAEGHYRQEVARYQGLAAEYRQRMEAAAVGSADYHDAESRAMLYDYLAFSAGRWLIQERPTRRRPNAGEPPETLGC